MDFCACHAYASLYDAPMHAHASSMRARRSSLLSSLVFCVPSTFACFLSIL
ncbi:uncharacterized protein DS421_15g500030 [Arachis hypogaea]|nr:uncharacterized protein DS421_15g500030 [Arachis hypogaea]